MILVIYRMVKGWELGRQELWQQFQGGCDARFTGLRGLVEGSLRLRGMAKDLWFSQSLVECFRTYEAWRKALRAYQI